MKTRYMAIAATALMVISGTALAKDPIAIDFTAHTTNKTKAFMSGEADGIMSVASTWDPVEDPGGALNGIKGDCFGTARMAAGRMIGDGYCAYTDPEGQTLFIRWYVHDATAPFGTWQFAGGTGKWAGAVGGGLFADTPTQQKDVILSHITGTVEFK